jgi:hypothetical protein
MIFLKFIMSVGIMITRPGHQKHSYNPVNSKKYVHNHLINTATIAAGGKGFSSAMLADPNVKPDNIPVDVCIQFMILAAWCKAVGR